MDFLNYISNTFDPRACKAGYELGQVFLLNLWSLAFSIQVDGEQKTLYLFSVLLKTESEGHRLGVKGGIQ